MQKAASSLDATVFAASSGALCDRDSVLFTLKMLSLHPSPSWQHHVCRRLSFDDSANETHRPLAKHNQNKNSSKSRIEVTFSVQLVLILT